MKDNIDGLPHMRNLLAQVWDEAYEIGFEDAGLALCDVRRANPYRPASQHVSFETHGLALHEVPIDPTGATIVAPSIDDGSLGWSTPGRTPEATA